MSFDHDIATIFDFPSKKAFKPIDLKALYILVAGAGFEPTTFGL